MKTFVRAACLAAILVLAAIETGCGSPPQPARSAKKDIDAAESAMSEGESRFRRKEYEEAKTQYEVALTAINKGLDYATGPESSKLSNMKSEAIGKKSDSERLARQKAAEQAAKIKPAATAANTAVAVVDPEIAKKAAEKAREAELAEKAKVLDTLGKTAAPKKAPDEPEDAGEVAANKKEKAPNAGNPNAVEGDNPPPKKKDPNGIFPDITAGSPPLQVVKMVKQGKFVVAYVQLYNKSENGKRITVANFFKSGDNQDLIRPTTAPSFPYQGFSLKVKDLIGDQSVRNFTMQGEEIQGGEYLQFVSVGECDNEAQCAKVAKLYCTVTLSDGTKVDATGPDGGAGSKSMPLPVQPSLKIK